MARQIVTTLIDDLDGTEAEETVTFAIDGVAYSIDLSGANGLKLRQFLEPYIASGTKLGRVQGNPQLTRNVPQTIPVRQNRQENAEIRQWAEANGHDISDRGRIPQHVVDAYHSRSRVAAGLKEQAQAQTAVSKAASEAKPAAPQLDFKPEVAPARKKTPAKKAAAKVA